MSEYAELEKLYYKKIDTYKEFVNRFQNPCTLKTSLFINPVNNTGEMITKKEFELFYLPIQPILFLQEQINKNSKKIIELSKELPEIAKNSCIIEIMLNEIVKSNEVEGVYTTKKEVYDSITTKKMNRLTGIVKKYIQIKNNEDLKIEKVEDFRKLYDDVFSEDILLDPDNKLDGKLFRATSVKINDGLKNIHTGVFNEDKIVECLNQLIEFMNNKEINFLIKTSITHYYFEYIHPFYDGNGRTGRLLCSMYLARKLDIFSALSLSYAIFEEKNKYSKLFKKTSNIKNYGEVTFFIKGFLELIVKGQESIIEMLKNKVDKLNFSKEIIKSLDISDNERKILDIYLQIYIFSKTSVLKDSELEKILDISRPTLNKLLKALEEKNYLNKTSSKPVIRAINDEIIPI